MKEQFENDTEVEEKLKGKNINVLNVPEFFKQLKEKNINVLNVPEFFKQLKEKVDNYYTEKVDG